MEYRIKACEVGYIIADESESVRGLLSKIWAFTTLAEALAYMPILFEQKEAKDAARN